MRRKTRELKVGKVGVGGGSPISVQSMTNTNTADVGATVAQIKALEKAGCEIVRVAVPDMDAAGSIGGGYHSLDVRIADCGGRGGHRHRTPVAGAAAAHLLRQLGGSS